MSFWAQYGQKWRLKSAKMTKMLTQNRIFWGHLSTFQAENTPKSRSFKGKTKPKYFINNSKTTLKKSSKCLTENLNFRNHLSTFRAENTPKSRPLRSKTMPKHFINNSKTTLKKSGKWLFRPPIWPKHGCQLGRKCLFLGKFSLYELYFWLLGTKKIAKIVPPIG